MIGRIVRALPVAFLIAGGLVAHSATAAPATTTLPALVVGDVGMTEGNAGPAVITVPVDLSFPPAAPVTVHYVVDGGTATAGSDYEAKSGVLSFPRGVSARTVTVTIFGDTDPEGDEDVHVTLSAPVGATIADGIGDVAIQDDDGAGDQYSVALGDATVTEASAGKHYVFIPVTLSVPAAATVKVKVFYECGSPLADETYGIQPSRVVTFARGQRVKNLQFVVPTGVGPEAIEQFWQKLTVQVGGVIATEPTGTVTIINPHYGSEPVGTIDRVSVANDGSEAQFLDQTPCHASMGSFVEASSTDGRYVVFASDAVNLVPGDTNDAFDLFVRDRQANTTDRVDLTDTGGELSQGDDGGASGISDDGRYVLYSSASPEILPTGTTAAAFVRDRTTGTNELVSVLPDGTIPASAVPSGMSSDGRYVSFAATGGGLYVRDRVAETTQYVASTTGWRRAPITADGSEVAFVSSDSTLVPGDTNNYPDVFVRNLLTGATERVSITPSGQQELGIGNSRRDNDSRLSMSSDGRYVAFWSASTDMLTSGHSGVMIRDRVAQTTEQASIGIASPSTYCWADGESVSNDGRYVSFSYDCQNSTGTRVLLSGAYVHDRESNATVRVDQLPDGSLPDNGTADRTTSMMSADGHYVFFASRASNFVPGDTNDQVDVFSKLIN